MPTDPTRLYAAVHCGNPGDVDYYRRACAGVRPALELGCGWGRIAHAMAADGVDVIGLERDPHLLAMGTDGPAMLQRSDMRAFSLGRRFDRVLIPYRGLYYLQTEQELLSCLRSVLAHLAPAGLLVFDAYAADAFHATDTGDGPDEDALGLVRIVTVDGVRYDVYEQSLWEPAEQCLTTRYLHVPHDGGPPVETTISQRYLLSHQIAPLLERAGLELLALQGGFDQHAFDPDVDDLLIAIARVPPTA